MISENELKRLIRLKQKKYRMQEKRFLVEGVRLVEEALYADAAEAVLTGVAACHASRCCLDLWTMTAGKHPEGGIARAYR